MTGTLFLIPSTLGEMAVEPVLPLETLRIAARLEHFIVENAKSARAFLKRVHNQVPLSLALQDIRMDELNVSTPEARWPELLAPLLAGQDVGLVSEAGCPAVADPGSGLVALAHESGIAVRPLVGPSSILLALMASGLNGQRFAFEGYLPIDASARRARIGALEARSACEGQTQIMIETPYRNGVLLEALAATLQPQTRLCIACDLTLPLESIRTQSVAQWRKSPIEFKRRPAIFLFQARP
jgi:16S rRNA (cytidine1402-2'-O)-methyltransferase